MASDTTSRPPQISEPRLWFGLATAFFAWHLLGTAEMFITWRAGLHAEAFGNAVSSPAAYAASFAVTGFLLGISVLAGYVSYRNWRQLAPEPSIYEAEGRNRREYMALLGVLATVILGIAMIWMLIPLFILRYGARVR